MAQADGVVANGTGSAVRADINGQLAALFTNHSGSTEPATTYSFQTWADTNTNTLKLRNSSNDGWVQLARLDGQFDAKTFNSNVTLNAQSDLRFADSDSSNWVAFQAPATVASNVTWTLPSADGTADQALVTNGSGTLSWADSGGGDNITEGNTSAEVVDTGSDGHFKVITEGTEALRVDSSQRLGIGTTSPGSYNADGNQLVVGSGSGNQGLTINAGASSLGSIFFAKGTLASDPVKAWIKADGASEYLAFGTANAERMRIDSSGKLGIGTSSPRLRTHILGDAANFPTLGVASGSLIVGPSDRDYGMMFGVSSSGLGWIQAQNFITTGAAYNLHLQPSGGSIDLGATGDISSAVSTTGFKFVTGNGFWWTTTGANSYWNVNTDTFLNFRRNGTQVGNINWSSSSTAFVTSSDYRMKENIVVLDGAIDRVKQLLPKRFNFIVTPDKTVDGFLAHEAQTVVPEAVTGVKDELQVWLADEELPEGVSVGDLKLDDDGNPLPKYQGIDQAKLVPLLTAALQEAIAKIETLETANASLEARLTALEGGAS